MELPVEVALARPLRELPADLPPGTWLEPKVDGWRVQLATGPDAIAYSRHGTNLSRAFADLVAAARELPPAVLDGELLAVRPDGSLAFGLLQTRAGRSGPRPSEGFHIQFAAFDQLATGRARRDLRARPLRERREHLEQLLTGAAGSPLWALPTSTDLEQARSWVGALGGGIEGAVVKPSAAAYLPRYGSGWLKWRAVHTVEAVVCGITPGTTPASQAAVLAQPGRDGHLRPVGVSLPLPAEVRAELAQRLRPTGTGMEQLAGTVGGLPGAAAVTYRPVHPDVVVEIAVDQAELEFGRYRHRPRVLRIRGDLEPGQLTSPNP